MSDPLEEMTKSFPEMKSEVQIFAHEKSCGMVIRWIAKGVGFGELTIACNKATGEWHVDTETMGPKFCERVLKALKGTQVESYD